MKRPVPNFYQIERRRPSLWCSVLSASPIYPQDNLHRIYASRRPYHTSSPYPCHPKHSSCQMELTLRHLAPWADAYRWLCSQAGESLRSHHYHSNHSSCPMELTLRHLAPWADAYRWLCSQAGESLRSDATAYKRTRAPQSLCTSFSFQHYHENSYTHWRPGHHKKVPRLRGCPEY